MRLINNWQTNIKKKYIIFNDGGITLQHEGEDINYAILINIVEEIKWKSLHA